MNLRNLKLAALPLMIAALLAIAASCGSNSSSKQTPTTGAPTISGAAADVSAVPSPSRTGAPIMPPTVVAPTNTPVPPPPSPTRAPPPTPVPICHSSAPPNPYGFDFCSGSLISSPPADICSYIACIQNFWNGRGYVIQCSDGTFGKSGGIRGSCSYHGGNSRPLYAH